MRYLLPGPPGVRGGFKEEVDDFRVEELPLFPPEGEGEHALLWVEKRDLNTHDVVRALAKALGAPERALGVAGQKDRRGVTRQQVSVPARGLSAALGPGGQLDPEGLPSGEGWRAYAGALHRSKLRTGALAGNRFELRLRGAGGQLEAAEAGLRWLSEAGLPNYFGPQRFGRDEQNATLGLAFLKGERPIRSRFHRRMAVSALQSALFNTWLDRRVDAGTATQALPGDRLAPRPSRKTFLCEDPALDTERMRAGDIDLMGPIFGHKVDGAAGAPGEEELALLGEWGLDLDDFKRASRDGEGARRPAWAPVREAAAWIEGDDLWLRFALPRGSYATTLLAQLEGEPPEAEPEGPTEAPTP